MTIDVHALLDEAIRTADYARRLLGTDANNLSEEDAQLAELLLEIVRIDAVVSVGGVLNLPALKADVQAYCARSGSFRHEVALRAVRHGAPTVAWFDAFYGTDVHQAE